MVITRFFFGRNYLNRLETCIFPALRTQQVEGPSTQLIEVDGWSNRWKIRNGDEFFSGGAGPWISISFSLWCFQLFGDVWSLCRHNFSKNCIYFLFSWVFSFEQTYFWKYDDVLIPLWPPMAHKTATTLMNGPFTIHQFPLISHGVAQLDLPCHQCVFWTHPRLRQWRCSRLCWCPVCREAVVSGKWFAHWQCILCWQRPTVFAVWWINPVDRLTCSHCDTLGNNILKQLLESQLSHAINPFHVVGREVVIRTCV